MTTAEETAIAIPGGDTVSGLWLAPEGAQIGLALAHGAGAGMRHRAMTALAEGLATRGIATLRFQFPYMERGKRRPDPPKIAQAAVRAAVAQAHARAGGLAWFAGGRSFGARMTSQAQALSPLEGTRGLVLFAFPLHPAGKPATARAHHLADTELPMLFLQGTRDPLAEIDLLRGVVERFGPRAHLVASAHADHSFHVPVASGRKDADVLAELLDAAAAWMIALAR